MSELPQNCEQDGQSTEMTLFEPVYENIETIITPSDDNKFKIYVNYDFLSKSNVRLLEPDIVQIAKFGQSPTDHNRDSENGKSEKNVRDKTNLSKTMQCQQISMYIGEFFWDAS